MHRDMRYLFAKMFIVLICLLAEVLFSHTVCACDLDNFLPGQIVEQPQNDVWVGHNDIAKLDSKLTGETLSATFHINYIKDVPSGLIFNRVGVPDNYLGYGWGVYVDIDSDEQTGSDLDMYERAEHSLSAMRFVFEPNSPIAQPITDGVQVNTWEYDGDSLEYLAAASLQVDDQSDRMILIGDIPGIYSSLRVFFGTSQSHPGGTLAVDETSNGNAADAGDGTGGESGDGGSGCFIATAAHISPRWSCM